MAKEYEVLSITELSRIGDTGGIERFYRHKIKTKGGVVLTADISEKDFTADKAAPVLLQKATEADRILHL